MKKTMGDYHVYPIRGKDSNGEIDITRRFSNFYDFHEALKKRFPGLYIPPVPSKDMGKKNHLVVRDRQYFLDLFCKECCSLAYIAQSKEL